MKFQNQDKYLELEGVWDISGVEYFVCYDSVAFTYDEIVLAIKNQNWKRGVKACDIVKITGNLHGHCFENGEVVSLVRFDFGCIDDQPWRAVSRHGVEQWLSAEEFEVAEEGIVATIGEMVQIVSVDDVHCDEMKDMLGGVFPVQDIYIDSSTVAVNDYGFRFDNIKRLDSGGVCVGDLVFMNEYGGIFTVKRIDGSSFYIGDECGVIGAVHCSQVKTIPHQDLLRDYMWRCGDMDPATDSRKEFCETCPDCGGKESLKYSGSLNCCVECGQIMDDEEGCEFPGVEGIWDVCGIGYYIRWDGEGGTFKQRPVHGYGVIALVSYDEIQEGIEKGDWKQVEQWNLDSLDVSQVSVPKREVFKKMIVTPVDPYDMG